MIAAALLIAAVPSPLPAQGPALPGWEDLPPLTDRPPAELRKRARELREQRRREEAARRAAEERRRAQERRVAHLGPLEQGAATAPGELPATGSDPWGLALAGGGLLLAGGFLRRRGA